MSTPVALRALPSPVLMISCNVAIDIKALKVSAEVPTSGNSNRCISDWAMKLNQNLLRRLCLYLLNVFRVRVSRLSLPEESKRSFEAKLRLFHPVGLYEVADVLRLHYLYKEYSANLPWVVKISLMILLFLKDLQAILSSLYQLCDVHNFVLSFLLIVGRVGYPEFLALLAPIYRDAPKLRPAVLEAYSIQPYTPYLNS
jgi:hypothetical protein